MIQIPSWVPDFARSFYGQLVSEFGLFNAEGTPSSRLPTATEVAESLKALGVKEVDAREFMRVLEAQKGTESWLSRPRVSHPFFRTLADAFQIPDISRPSSHSIGSNALIFGLSRAYGKTTADVETTLRQTGHTNFGQLTSDELARDIVEASARHHRLPRGALAQLRAVEHQLTKVYPHRSDFLMLLLELRQGKIPPSQWPTVARMLHWFDHYAIEPDQANLSTPVQAVSQRTFRTLRTALENSSGLRIGGSAYRTFLRELNWSTNALGFAFEGEGLLSALSTIPRESPLSTYGKFLAADLLPLKHMLLQSQPIPKEVGRILSPTHNALLLHAISTRLEDLSHREPSSVAKEAIISKFSKRPRAPFDEIVKLLEKQAKATGVAADRELLDALRKYRPKAVETRQQVRRTLAEIHAGGFLRSQLPTSAPLAASSAPSPSAMRETTALAVIPERKGPPALKRIMDDFSKRASQFVSAGDDFHATPGAAALTLDPLGDMARAVHINPKALLLTHAGTAFNFAGGALGGMMAQGLARYRGVDSETRAEYTTYGALAGNALSLLPAIGMVKRVGVAPFIAPALQTMLIMAPMTSLVDKVLKLAGVGDKSSQTVYTEIACSAASLGLMALSNKTPIGWMGSMALSAGLIAANAVVETA